VLQKANSTKVESVLQYRGKQMPMISFLLVNKHNGFSAPASFTCIDPDDYALAVTQEHREHLCLSH